MLTGVRRRGAGADQESLVQVVQRLRHGLRPRAGINADGRLNAHSGVRVLTAVMGLRLWVLDAVLSVVTRLFFGRFVQHALVMLGVLQIAFGQNAVAGRGGVARQSLVFLANLHGVAANADVGAVAIEGLDAGIQTASLLVIVVSSTAAAIVMVAVAATSAAHMSAVLIVSHAL